MSGRGHTRTSMRCAKPLIQNDFSVGNENGPQFAARPGVGGRGECSGLTQPAPPIPGFFFCVALSEHHGMKLS